MSTKHQTEPAENKPLYPAVNNFKFLAALLVIAIHTSPLTSISPEADFILTRILARVAVPFFFLVTGYFVLPRAVSRNDQALSYLKRIGLIYLGSVLLYLPVGIYAGHFKGSGVWAILKMLLLDGTFYHLWYLPALLLGFALALLLLRALPLPAALGISMILYLMGLPGDSYYGLLPNPSWLHSVYQGILTVFEYTRNGLFYAPVFLVMGFLLKNRQPSWVLSLAGIGVSSALLLGEGITLHLLDVQRHDSMYLALLPLMYFLFSALLYAGGADWGKRLGIHKDLPLFLYILHPLFIILVRGGAKILKLPVFIDNSLLHFAAVAVSTVGFSWGILLLWEKVKKINMP